MPHSRRSSLTSSAEPGLLSSGKLLCHVGAWEFSHGNQSEDLDNFNQVPDGKGFFPGNSALGRALSDSLLSAWSREHSATVCGNEFGINKLNLQVRGEEDNLHADLGSLAWCPPMSLTYLTRLL